jgi:hypothetical protein
VHTDVMSSSNGLVPSANITRRGKQARRGGCAATVMTDSKCT